MARGRKKESLTPEEHLQAALVPESEQPYKVPGNWCWTYLTKGAAECLDSFRKPINASERANREGDIPYYGATGQVGWIDDFLTNEQLVLVGEDGAPFLDLIKDKAYIIEGKAWVNNHAHILRSRFGAVGNLFLLHYLNIFNYRDFVNGTTRLKLTQSSMDTMPVPIPPFSEQQRIVDRIESLFAKLDEAKQKAQDALDSFETRKAAILHKAFTGELTAQWRKEHGVGMESWENLKFENIIEDGPQNGLYKPQTAYGTGTKTLRIDCFYDGAVLPWENLKRLALTKNEIEQYHLNVNDIVINRVNSMAYLGKSALIRELPEECVFESNMMRISLTTQKAIPEYIIKYLNSVIGVQELRKNAKQAVNQASINQQDVKNVAIKLPKLEEQAEIVRIVDDLLVREQQAKEAAEGVLEKIDLIKKAILARAFRGELGTNDPSEESAVGLLKTCYCGKLQS